MFKGTYKNKFKKLAGVAAVTLYLAAAPSMVVLGQHGTPEVLPSNTAVKSSFIFDISMNYALGHKGVTGHEFLDQDALSAFYAERDNLPLWMTKHGFTAQGQVMFNRISTAWSHGLNPDTYHFKKISKLKNQPNFLRMAQLELLMTDAFMRYARDLSGIRITDARRLQTDVSYWRQPMAASETLEYLKYENLNDGFAAIEPQSPTYKKLRAEMLRIAADNRAASYDHVLPIEFGYMIRPGERHKSIPALRTRLGTEAQTRDRLRYDDRLVAAVRRFQRENNLNDDGIVGTNTLRLLNRTRTDKMKQLAANMERLRWVHPERADKFIAVNIPSFKMWGIENGKVALEMPVIVGNPGRKTQSFVTHIEGVRFNPDWTIPATIKRFDIWPKVKQDTNYLNDKGIELVRGYGDNRRTMSPRKFDWAGMSWPEVRDIRMVQNPGENNPLGRVRVLMPNKYNIYLHDTNKPEYFERTERALSSGCIRVKYPEKVADFIMKSRSDWNAGMMHAALEEGKKTDISIDEDVHMPVYIYYYTNWIDKNGNVVFGNDIYKNDSRLIDMLAEIDGVAIPGYKKPETQKNGDKQLLKLASAAAE